MNFEDFITSIKDWGEITEGIYAIILVGSYAIGAQKPTSDIDLVILTKDKEKLISSPEIFDRFGKSEKTCVEYYGAVTSIRIFYEDGFEVEYGITNISWIDKPLDDGTRQVLNDGFKVIVDKGNHFDKQTIGDNDEKIL